MTEQFILEKFKNALNKAEEYSEAKTKAAIEIQNVSVPDLRIIAGAYDLKIQFPDEHNKHHRIEYQAHKDVIIILTGSGTTLLAAVQCDRQAYGFEIKKNFFKEANEKILRNIQNKLF